MRTRNFSQKLAEISCAVVLIYVFTLPQASANSAMTHWSGTDSSGVIAMDEECPIVVENELLTFDISDFPRHFYENEEEHLAYSAKVTAQYTFYNPTNYTITAHLLFPFGNLPEYGGYYDFESDIQVYPENIDDTSKFDITVDGEIIEKNLRYTLLSSHHSFNLEEDLAKLHDGYVEDSFFEPSMPVTKYTYLISGVDEKNSATSVAFDINKFNGKTKVMLVNSSGAHTQENGQLRLSMWAEKNKNITLYVFGEPLNTLEWTFYKDGGVEDGDEIGGNITLLTTEEMTFEEYALSSLKDKSGILAHDWYNAVVAHLNSHSLWDEHGDIDYIDWTANYSSWLMRWYEYDITIEPGERVVNSVTAPMYPAINDDWNPSIYEYTYLLSPAQTWSEFGNLEIIINTPFSLTESNLDGFKKEDGGYRLSLEGLPNGDLQFTLCSEENPEFHKYTSNSYKNTNYFIVFSVIFGVMAVVLFSVLHAIKRINKQKM